MYTDIPSSKVHDKENLEMIKMPTNGGTNEWLYFNGMGHFTTLKN